MKKNLIVCVLLMALVVPTSTAQAGFFGDLKSFFANFIDNLFGQEVMVEPVVEEPPVVTPEPEPPVVTPEPPVVTPTPEPPVITPEPPVSDGSYDIDDIASVAVHVEGRPEIDAAWNVYTIRLINGVTHEVRVGVMVTAEMVAEEFYATGYTGDVTKLVAVATKVTGPNDGKSIIPEIVSAEVDGLTVLLTLKASRIEAISACGPIFFAQVNWGADASEDVQGLGCSSTRQTLTAEHTFAEPGAYTIYVSDKYGNEVTTSVTVGGAIAYTIADVVSVVISNVDPIPMAIDDEYTLYTITLDDDSVRTSRIYGMATQEMNANNLYDTGYTGDPGAIWNFNE